MADTYKLTIKLPSGAEFQGEGPEESVRQDYQLFIETAGKTTAPALPPGQQMMALPPAAPLVAPLATQMGSPAVLLAAPVLERTTVERLFSVDKAGTVSLRALPRSEARIADALIALLYGHQILRGEHAVTSGRLMKGARQSGVNVDRIDRVLASQSAYVNAAGFKKGRRYGLNNPGVKRAEEILLSILG